VSLPHHHDLCVGVHCLPHAKVQGDLEPCLTGTRRVLPIHFDHAAVDRPRVETRAPEMCAQGFGQLGFLERDQQSVRSVLVVRRRGCRAPPHRARQADYRRRRLVHSSPIEWFIQPVHITRSGEARISTQDLPCASRRGVGAAATVSSAHRVGGEEPQPAADSSICATGVRRVVSVRCAASTCLGCRKICRLIATSCRTSSVGCPRSPWSRAPRTLRASWRRFETTSHGSPSTTPRSRDICERRWAESPTRRDVARAGTHTASLPRRDPSPISARPGSVQRCPQSSSLARSVYQLLRSIYEERHVPTFTCAAPVKRTNGPGGRLGAVQRELGAPGGSAGPEIRSGGSRPNPSRVEQGAIPNPCC
jgi:hypothetical protein